MLTQLFHGNKCHTVSLLSSKRRNSSSQPAYLGGKLSIKIINSHTPLPFTGRGILF